jgi:hypothetical protein
VTRLLILLEPGADWRPACLILPTEERDTGSHESVLLAAHPYRQTELLVAGDPGRWLRQSGKRAAGKQGQPCVPQPDRGFGAPRLSLGALVLGLSVDGVRGSLTRSCWQTAFVLGRKVKSEVLSDEPSACCGVLRTCTALCLPLPPAEPRGTAADCCGTSRA